MADKIPELELDKDIVEDIERRGKVEKGVKEIISETSLEPVTRLSSPKSLYRIIVEEWSENTRNTAKQLEYLSAYEQTLGIFRTTALALRKEMDVLALEQRLGAITQAWKSTVGMPKGKEEINVAEGLNKDITEAIFFSNRYALYFAGQAGLAMLDGEKAETVTQLFSFGEKYDASKDRDQLTAKLAQMTMIKLLEISSSRKEQQRRPATDEELKYTLEAVFTTWVEQFSWLTWKGVAEKYGIEKVKLKFQNYSLQAGEFKQKYDAVVVDDKFMPIGKEDIIGGEGLDKDGQERLGTVLWKDFKKLACYDHERRKNPHKPAYVVFTYGEPGCGKTFVSHGYIQEFAKLCREKGIPLWALTHSTTDYATEYQNKTANELAKLAQRIRDFPGIVLMYVADADNIFLSRKDDLKAEQKNTLNVYLKMFDGTMIPKNGKFLSVMDANYLDGIDDATKSRLFDKIVEMKRFHLPDDFAALAKKSIAGGVDGIPVNEADWLDVGKYILDTPLSNREIGHVLRDISSGYDIPDELLGRPFEEHIAYRNEHLRAITKEVILGKFDRYIQTRALMEDQAQQAKVSDSAERFLEALLRKRGDTPSSEK